jgi:hypothetical protein
MLTLGQLDEIENKLAKLEKLRTKTWKLLRKIEEEYHEDELMGIAYSSLLATKKVLDLKMELLGKELKQ